ncbi:MAG: hypothetical protein RLY20_2388 [Verrucomicrobiota bacterium]
MTSDPANSSPADSSFSVQAELEVLFEESAALANRIKKNARLLHRNDNLSAGGRILLQTLQLHGPMTVPQLATIRSTSRQNIQVLADRLEQSGHIAFVTNPNHKRSVLVALTEAGKALLTSASERESSLIDAILPNTAATQLRDAAELLRNLRYQLGGAPKRRKQPTPRAKIPREQTDIAAEQPIAAVAVVSTSAPSDATVEDDELPVSLL